MEHLIWPSLEQLMNFVERAALPDERTCGFVEEVEVVLKANASIHS